MKIERGVHAAGIRLNLILHSEDGTAHSYMSDRVEAFEAIADTLTALACERVRAVRSQEEDGTVLAVGADRCTRNLTGFSYPCLCVACRTAGGTA
jgi:hypothetical protein